MELLNKVTVNPNICGIELDFNGELSPDNSEVLKSFYNSVGSNSVWNNSYFGKKTVRFSETSKKHKAGIYYTQSLMIKVPSNDANRSERLNLFTKTKNIKVNLDNNSSLVLGRNDIFQNKRPNVTVSSSEKMTTLTFATTSIFSAGFYNSDAESNVTNDLLPHDIPITFINI